MKVYLGDRKIALDPSMAIGKGGEADVYDVGGGVALKVFKGPGHADLRHSPADRRAASARLAIHQTKLRQFPVGLPDRVVAPITVATDRRKNGAVVGYSMRHIAGAEMLVRYAEPRFRRHGIDGNQVTSMLRDLRTSVAAVHDARVVIGDFNDLNVLVTGARAYLIDADSFQYGGHPCTVYSERFVDPLLCDRNANAPVLSRPHTEDSDWYAYAVMVLRSLLCVGPYGGVFRPSDEARRLVHSARPLHRVTIFDADVIFPKPAIHYRALPDDLLHYFHRVFERDDRGAFPTALLDGLRWTRCGTCRTEHARIVCPSCASGQHTSARTTLRIRGDVTAERIFHTTGVIVASKLDDSGPRWLYWQDGGLYREDGVRLADVALAPHRLFARHRDGAVIGERGRLEVVAGDGAREVLAADSTGGRVELATNADDLFWLQGGRLLRGGDFGPAHIGDVLMGQTRFWVGEGRGFGFYRAGNLGVAFSFDTARTGIDDSVELPAFRGPLLSAHCALGRSSAWLFTEEQVGGVVLARCVLIGREGRALAAAQCRAEETTWLVSGRGSCAVGDFLFVPTDAGIVRVERDQGQLVVTRTFPDTEPFVDSGCRLHAGASGLFVVRRDQILRLTLR